MKIILTIALSLAFTTLIIGRAFGEQAGSVTQQQVKEAVAPPQSLTIEEQEEAPMRLILVSAWAVPEHKHLVELEFMVHDLSSKPIKAYTIRGGESWDDAQSGNGTANHEMPYTVASANAEARRISFRARINGKVKAWVASVEYEDGSVWKSKLAEVGKEKEKPQ